MLRQKAREDLGGGRVLKKASSGKSNGGRLESLDEQLEEPHPLKVLEWK